MSAVNIERARSGGAGVPRGCPDRRGWLKQITSARTRIGFSRLAVRAGRECSMKYVLLLIPCVLALATPWYNSLEPRLFGIPFFYWFQLVLIPVSSAFIYLVYRSEQP
jgi:hypothetical protein